MVAAELLGALDRLRCDGRRGGELAAPDLDQRGEERHEHQIGLGPALEAATAHDRHLLAGFVQPPGVRHEQRAISAGAERNWGVAAAALQFERLLQIQSD